MLHWEIRSRQGNPPHLSTIKDQTHLYLQPWILFFFHDQVGSTPGSQNGSTRANQSMWYTTSTKRKDKNHMSISVEAEKNILQNSTSIHDKNPH